MKPSELIADPASWCQGYEAIDIDGDEVDADSRAACRWCLVGAIVKCRITSDELDVLYRRVPHLTRFNDSPGRTHAEVIAALKEAGL